jgi:hypothetical protein
MSNHLIAIFNPFGGSPIDTSNRGLCEFCYF